METLIVKTRPGTDLGLGAWTPGLHYASEHVAMLALPSLEPEPPSIRLGAMFACLGPCAPPQLRNAYRKILEQVRNVGSMPAMYAGKA